MGLACGDQRMGGLVTARHQGRVVGAERDSGGMSSYRDGRRRGFSQFEEDLKMPPPFPLNPRTGEADREAPERCLSLLSEDAMGIELKGQLSELPLVGHGRVALERGAAQASGVTSR